MIESILELERPHVQEVERYSHSLSSLRALGRVSLDIIPLTRDVPEVQEAWTDFVSALEENIATDPELSDKLTFNPLRFHEVADGRVVDRTNRRVADLVEDGLSASKQQALFDKQMLVQVERDEGDVLVANAVDNLLAGQMLATISMDPKEALGSDKAYWEDKAYREGMAVLQVYYRNEDGLLAGAYAIKDSDTDDLRELFADYGLTVPNSENCNRWTRHHLKMNLSEIEAKTFGDDFVKAYRQKRGLEIQQISTTDFLQKNQTEVQSFFDAHIVPVATSTVTRKNNESTKSLATSLHQHNATSISINERKHLLKIANSDKFDDTDARFMESKIRYALIEHLRPKLLQLFEPAVNLAKEPHVISHVSRIIAVTDHIQLQQMNTDLSLGLGRGVRDNRAYGGCSSSRTESNSHVLDLGNQDVFGGKSDSDSKQPSDKKDEFGSLEFKCTKGHTNKREKGGWVYECQKCGEDVSCGKKKS